MTDFQYAIMTLAVALIGGILVGWLNLRLDQAVSSSPEEEGRNERTWNEDPEDEEGYRRAAA